jgi:hypothetical protein
LPIKKEFLVKSEYKIKKCYTNKKESNIFLIYKEIKRDGCKVINDSRPPPIWGKICAFPHILGSPSSYMNLHSIPSEFPYTVYEKHFAFFFLYQFRIERN